MSFKTARMSGGMTQDQIAKRLDISRSTVAMWETGRTFPRGATLLRLGEILGCTVDELLKGEGKEHDGNRDEA